MIRRALIGYLITFLIIAALMMFDEPSLVTYGDALWYAFVASTTIGFGDFTAVSFFGRVLTVILYIYTILIIAVITAVFTHFFIEVAKASKDDSILEFQYDLEHLPDLSQERLAEISEKIRKLRTSK